MQLSPIPPQRPAPIVISEERAAYRIAAPSGFYGPDDTLYAEGEMIYWDETPAIDMEPLNTLARENKKKYLEELDELGRAAAEKIGKGYTGYSQTTENAMELERLNAKQVQVIGGVKQKQVMGNPSKGKGRVEAITGAGEMPMTGGSKHTGTLSLGSNVAVPDLGKGS